MHLSISSPARQPFLSRGPGTVPAYQWVASSSSLPTHGIIWTSHRLCLQELGIAPPSWYYKPCCPQPLVVHCIPEYNPCVALQGSVFLPPTVMYGLINCCQSPLPNARCWGSAIPTAPGQNLSVINKVSREWWNSIWKKIVEVIKCFTNIKADL